MLENTKINFSQKKLMGKQHTWNSKIWYEEDDGIVLFQHAKEVWINKIGPDAPAEETREVRPHINLIMTEDDTVQGRRSWIAKDALGNRITGFVQPSYGLSYSVKLFINGKKIPTTHESIWMFDYANGVLTFENTPPHGLITIIAYEYIGKTLQQYLDAELNSIAIGVLGNDNPQLEYVIQHNMGTFDVDVTIYVFDEVDGIKYWKKDVIPLILLDENRVKIQLTEKQPMRFIIKSYNSINFI